MIDNDLQKFIGSMDLTLSQAMKKLDENGSRIILIVDKSNHLMGCLTDGDIRRYLLAGGKLDDDVKFAVNTETVCANTLDEAKELIKNKKYIAIPIIDSEKHIKGLYFKDYKIHDSLPKLKVPVVINAGGKGTRLDPYTKILPKPLIPVGEIPIIEHIMKRFLEYDCKQFHIIVNYKKQIMKGYFSENEGRYDISWYEEDIPLGTGGGLALLKGKINETFFFTNCDNLLLSDYDSILRFHKENHNAITMICAYKNIQIPYGVVEMGINGSIKEMKEKPQLSFLTNTGIYVVEPEVLNDMKDGVAIGFPDVVEQQKSMGRNVAIYPVSENDWLDMGQLPELENMHKRLYGE